MKKIIILLLICNHNISFAQIKIVTGYYKVTSIKLDNDLILNEANRDSIIKLKIDMALAEQYKNGETPLTYEDTLSVINQKRNFFEQIFTLTIQLKIDGKYNKKMQGKNKKIFEIIESGTYGYNAKTNIIKFVSKFATENEKKQLVKYAPKTKTINFIASEEESDAGETIVQFKKVK